MIDNKGYLAKRALFLIGSTYMLLNISGCSTRYVDQNTKSDNFTQGLNVSEVGYKLNTKSWTPEPNCILVMPIKSADSNPDHASLVRRGLYAHLAPKGYDIAKMSAIDALIASKDNIKDVEIAEKLQCDYALSGEVTDFNKDYFIVYSEINVGAKVSLKRISSQQVLWEATHTTSLKDGGLPLSPLAATSSVFLAGRNLADDQTLRAVDDLSRHLMNTLPDANISAFSSFVKKENLSWKENIDTWLSSIAEIDREFELNNLLKRSDLTELQRESAFSRLVLINDKPYYRLQWAEYRMQYKNHTGALELLDDNIFKDSKNPQFWYIRGRVLATLGRFDEADKSLISAISRNKGSVDYYNALAYVNSRRGNIDRTRIAYEKVIQLDFNQPFAWYNIAILDFNAGNYQKSLSAFSSAGKLYKQQNRQDQVDRVIGDLQDLVPFIKKEEIIKVQESLNI